MTLFLPYAAISVAHLVILAGSDGGAAASVSKALLMPLLVVPLVPLLRRRDARPGWLAPVLVALAFSWFGDLALNRDGDTFFLLGIGFFLVAQLAYIAAFRRTGDPARTAGRRWLALPYVLWWLGFLTYFVVDTGPDPMLVAVGAYGIALGTMAYLAHRVNVVTAAGAALFLVSDSLIGLGGFTGLDLPLHDVWVMSTYTLGQGMIVAGLLLRRLGHTSPAGRTRHGAQHNGDDLPA